MNNAHTIKYEPNSFDARFADHDSRLTSVEKEQDEQKAGMQRIEEKIDSQTKWLLGTFASVTISLVLFILSQLFTKVFGK